LIQVNQKRVKQMLAIKKNQLSIPLLAMIAVVLAPGAAHASTAGDTPATRALNTSPLWADSDSYHACNVVNVSLTPVNMFVDIISASGTVLATSGTTAVSLPAGTSLEVSTGGYTGFARCRIRLASASETIRANMTVFHYIAGVGYQTYATSEAR
jgi:hypothetical protein